MFEKHGNKMSEHFSTWSVKLMKKPVQFLYCITWQCIWQTQVMTHKYKYEKQNIFDWFRIVFGYFFLLYPIFKKSSLRRAGCSKILKSDFSTSRSWSFLLLMNQWSLVCSTKILDTFEKNQGSLNSIVEPGFLWSGVYNVVDGKVSICLKYFKTTKSSYPRLILGFSSDFRCQQSALKRTKGL